MKILGFWGVKTTAHHVNSVESRQFLALHSFVKQGTAYGGVERSLIQYHDSVHC